MNEKIECTKINVEMEVTKTSLPFLEETRKEYCFENYGEMFIHSFRYWKFDHYHFGNNMTKILTQIEKALSENKIKDTLQKFDFEIWIHPENQKPELKKITKIIDLDCEEEENE